jgi:hypothetical protein
VTVIQGHHSIFSNYIPPVPRLIKAPLVLHRVGIQSANLADLDNQIATYININMDLESGYAPPEAVLCRHRAGGTEGQEALASPAS